MKTSLFWVLALFAAVLCADIRISNLEFSTDGGRSWKQDFPVLVYGENMPLDVRFSFLYQETRIPRYGAIMGKIETDGGDFASCRRRRLSHKTQSITGHLNWVQDTQAISPRNPRPFIVKMNFGKRPPGIIGKNNLYNKVKKKWENGPLPPLEPWQPGVYHFWAIVSYIIDEGKKTIPYNDSWHFEVTILPETGSDSSDH